MILNPSLSHDCISQMPGFYGAVHRKSLICKRAEPNVMVAFAAPPESTAVFAQFLTDFLFIFCHGYATRVWRSILNRRAMFPWFLSLSSNSSGAASLTLSIRVSREGDSRAMGMSSFSATHTEASSSQVNDTMYSVIIKYKDFFRDKTRAPSLLFGTQGWGLLHTLYITTMIALWKKTSFSS